MSKINEDKETKWVDTEPQEVRVRVWGNGDIDIRAYDVSKENLKAIAEITGKAISGSKSCSWIEFAKARDKTQVTFFAK